MHPRLLFIILDGFGIGPQTPYNAILKAKMPFLKNLLKKLPSSSLWTHGPYVGLPPHTMGNSEVGHMTIGAGQIRNQVLVRIQKAIQSKAFFKNPTIKQTLQTGAQKTGRVHLFGLFSDGGVHSHIEHLFALLTFCQKQQVPQVLLHLFLDGRDRPPKSSPLYFQQLFQHPIWNSHDLPRISIASIMGRYYGMDRDQNWDRTQKALQTLLGNTQPFPSQNPSIPPALEAIEHFHSQNITDEFIPPTLFTKEGAIQKQDSAFFFNFRSDRARQLTKALLEQKQAPLSNFSTMTAYDTHLKVPVAFLEETIELPFGAYLAQQKIPQFRIAETEKYAHVTYFFNNGRETPFPYEERLLIPSPKEVATYDQKPEMSAYQVTEALTKRLEKKQDRFLMVNYANPDMVGHTGVFLAAVQALETIDHCLETLFQTCQKQNVQMLLSADHGNIEQMQHPDGTPHTQHTLNPVPLLYIPSSCVLSGPHMFSLREGTLADLYSTFCDLLHLPIPSEVTGKSLIQKK